MTSLPSILLVEDDADDKNFFFDAIAEIKPGTKMIWAGNASIAMQYLKHTQHLPQYIFMDVQMPGISGIECLRNLKKEGALRDIPVIMLSDQHGGVQQVSLQLGAKAFIAKTHSYRALVNILRHYVSTDSANTERTVRTINRSVAAEPNVTRN